MIAFGKITPLKRCPNGGKPCYDKKTAVTAKNKRYKQDHVVLRIYNCENCNCWHLTSQQKI
jgi:hypothetical protein